MKKNEPTVKSYRMRHMLAFTGQTLYIQGLVIDVELDCTKYVLLSLDVPPQEVISTKKRKYITNCFFTIMNIERKGNKSFRKDETLTQQSRPKVRTNML